MEIVVDGSSTPAGVLAIFHEVSENTAEISRAFTQLFQRPSKGLFCLSDLLKNAADVFESLADVFELSSDRVFCLVMSVGETFEAVGAVLREACRRMDYIGETLKEQVAGLEAVGAERKASGSVLKAVGDVCQYVGCLKAGRVSRVWHL